MLPLPVGKEAGAAGVTGLGVGRDEGATLGSGVEPEAWNRPVKIKKIEQVSL